MAKFGFNTGDYDLTPEENTAVDALFDILDEHGFDRTKVNAFLASLNDTIRKEIESLLPFIEAMVGCAHDVLYKDEPQAMYEIGSKEPDERYKWN